MDDKFKYYGLTREHIEALQKNERLVEQLKVLRNNALNIGTNKLKTSFK